VERLDADKPATAEQPLDIQPLQHLIDSVLPDAEWGAPASTAPAYTRGRTRWAGILGSASRLRRASVDAAQSAATSCIASARSLMTRSPRLGVATLDDTAKRAEGAEALRG